MEVSVPIKLVESELKEMKLKDIVSLEIGLNGSSLYDLILDSSKQEAITDKLFSIALSTSEKDKYLMFDVPLDGLEFLAKGVLNQIEIVRRDYAKEIEFQLKIPNEI